MKSLQDYIVDAASPVHVEPAIEEVNPAPASCLAVEVWKPGPDEKPVEIPVRKLTARELTEEIFQLKSQIDDLGRKSVPFVAEAGHRFCQLENVLGVKGFKKWKETHKDRISETTIKRWRRVYNLWVTSDLSGMTLIEVYESLGIKNGSEKKKPEGNNKPDAEGNEPDNDDEREQDDDKPNEQRLFNPSHQAFCLFIKKFEDATPEERASTMIVVNEWFANQQPEAEAI